MREPFPSDVKSILSKVMRASPSDVLMIAERLHDSALEERMSPKDVAALGARLGYTDLDSFGDALGVPRSTVERWKRFGASAEMRQLLTLIVDQRLRMKAAVKEFEEMTHVGLDDFFRERGLL